MIFEKVVQRMLGAKMPPEGKTINCGDPVQDAIWPDKMIGWSASLPIWPFPIRLRCCLELECLFQKINEFKYK